MKAHIAIVLMLTGAIFHATAEPPRSLNTLAECVLTSTDSSDAIERLRAAGPAGLDAMFSVYGERIQRQQAHLAIKDADWEKLRDAFDTIAQQRDAFASHLYWYTNLDEAKFAARAAGKPILSLRLLGKLNEEYSCANSRFFRTTLYPNAEISRYLRDHFILHWQSVRPVPRITIDMGDGRRIERTITGNSIHYILDSDGNPIDALPGLYGAKAFIAELDHAVAAEKQASQLVGAERQTYLKNYHSTRRAEILQQWSAELAQVDPSTNTASDRPQLESLTTDADWQKITGLHLDQSVLDLSSTRLIQFIQPPTAAQAAPLAISKSGIEIPMVRMLRNLQHSIAEDTVHNEYQMHSQIHEWLAAGAVPENLEALNARIYAQLFLTPNSDPWLGLAPVDAFSALDNGGLVQSKAP
jgi:hypothetical protein